VRVLTRASHEVRIFDYLSNGHRGALDADIPLVLSEGAPSRTYNVGTGIPHSVREVLRAVERAAHRTVPSSSQADEQEIRVRYGLIRVASNVSSNGDLGIRASTRSPVALALAREPSERL
jgi:nucleoside-diphosphate-sugar epimerase